MAQDGDVVLVFSDGFHDNVYEQAFGYCIEEYLFDGLVTSLSKAVDCLARKAYFLGKDDSHLSPWMRELKLYVDNQIPMTWDPPREMELMGGKEDDITVMVAQVFMDRGEDDPRR